MHIQSGNICSFWNDIWIGTISLARLFPSLYKLSRNKHATLKDMVKVTNNDSAWDFNFTRNLKEEEVIMVADLLGQINDPILTKVGDDYLSWNQGNAFSVKSCYDAIKVAGFIRFPHKSLWNPRIPQKVLFFTWNLCYNATPTLDSLHNSIVINGCIM
ncbi:uncharacterized protein LOC113272638 [Papaver somniferum]|uniref:uncharacterized protein LOC113272638 n=1 Tax=Papaver somniferum TaxID=3469 RepID=UPI000E6F80BC|nr:uncharacterized protein LOC113272638 [Papaver somniferum]